VKDVTIEMKMTENVIKTKIVTIETMMRCVSLQNL